VSDFPEVQSMGMGMSLGPAGAVASAPWAGLATIPTLAGAGAIGGGIYAGVTGGGIGAGVSMGLGAGVAAGALMTFVQTLQSASSALEQMGASARNMARYYSDVSGPMARLVARSEQRAFRGRRREAALLEPYLDRMDKLTARWDETLSQLRVQTFKFQAPLMELGINLAGGMAEVLKGWVGELPAVADSLRSYNWTNPISRGFLGGLVPGILERYASAGNDTQSGAIRELNTLGNPRAQAIFGANLPALAQPVPGGEVGDMSAMVSRLMQSPFRAAGQQEDSVESEIPKLLKELVGSLDELVKAVLPFLDNPVAAVQGTAAGIVIERIKKAIGDILPKDFGGAN
jgi:hypothetical protein